MTWEHLRRRLHGMIRNGVTRKEIAHDLDVDVSRVGRWLRGNRPCRENEEALERLVRSYDRSGLVGALGRHDEIRFVYLCSRAPMGHRPDHESSAHRCLQEVIHLLRQGHLSLQDGDDTVNASSLFIYKTDLEGRAEGHVFRAEIDPSSRAYVILLDQRLGGNQCRDVLMTEIDHVLQDMGLLAPLTKAGVGDSISKRSARRWRTHHNE